jgi:hypothetical protein
MSNEQQFVEIAPPRFNVGDKVIVKNEEGPPFPATIYGVWWDAKYHHYEYSVMEVGELCSDGYTDEWLTPHRP